MGQKFLMIEVMEIVFRFIIGALWILSDFFFLGFRGFKQLESVKFKRLAFYIFFFGVLFGFLYPPLAIILFPASLVCLCYLLFHMVKIKLKGGL
ncbi:hypothetical protein [Campylobacter sp. 19-13652]|uniref:hypothetical protein n=1 Tax=Campylobacter sp. 19-13652 TaxID=2840180 RepID=UPI001C84E4EF|nr:hypothetical protein [Campylobacter sp. 19-13652]